MFVVTLLCSDSDKSDSSTARYFFICVTELTFGLAGHQLHGYSKYRYHFPLDSHAGFDPLKSTGGSGEIEGLSSLN